MGLLPYMSRFFWSISMPPIATPQCQDWPSSNNNLKTVGCGQIHRSNGPVIQRSVEPRGSSRNKTLVMLALRLGPNRSSGGYNSPSEASVARLHHEITLAQASAP